MSGRGPIHTRVNCPPYEIDCVTCGKGSAIKSGEGQVTLLHRQTKRDAKRERERERERVAQTSN